MDLRWVRGLSGLFRAWFFCGFRGGVRGFRVFRGCGFFGSLEVRGFRASQLELGLQVLRSYCS